MKIERFWLDRVEDESGISGIGRVAEGVIFSTGHCVLNWLTLNRSLAIYDNIKVVEAIHGHNGKTKITLEKTDGS